ncbi:iron-sulfur cluster repair di-iron protein [Mucilaginibacter mali]|uniref:Iron-sulfur cluster repair di-iron protein n=1 Tax=Mucilaginibacter mali TaxID=2740462 RepID=A0A7D4QG69_9SPHI|nr:iron-sulfur cluster repair di-iron protein [Mucilaginibacter mali]QKJ32964.1 iron-sulfur cluster repair di-iron protein [Mucilaginibacter mali]
MNQTEELQPEVLDVTIIEPRLKHPTIFARFDALLPGAALIIHNDHDPKPLYYQLLGERGNCFTWNYLENGPQTWEVEIRKNETGEQAQTLGEIVAKDLRKAEVFKKLGLDFCCGGKKTLEAACREKGLDVLTVRAELEKPQTVPAAAQHDFGSWSLAFLADYVVNVHHAYVKTNLPMLLELSEKVAKRHGGAHQELITVYNKVTAMGSELLLHLKKEETILFPYIKQLEARANGQDVPLTFSSVKEPVAVMENDHDIVGRLAEDIKALTNNYTLPENACNSYGLLFKKLEEFENDLHMHIHLENNILFPKAIALEQAGS